MHPFTLLFATAALALPLNINLGAYSPALVVGDGAISFEGAEAAEGAGAGAGAGERQGAAQVINALQGAAVGGAAAGAGAAGVNAAAAGPGVVQAAAVVEGPTGILDDPVSTFILPYLILPVVVLGSWFQVGLLGREG
jgi:hypothetical protein